MAISVEHSTSAENLGNVRIGLPIWQHASWSTSWLGEGRANMLSAYARHCTTIEGNTSFYQVPSVSTLHQWRDAVPDDFRFTFKFHQAISHASRLQHCQALIDQQLDVMLQLGPKLGMMLLQLPASFGPDRLASLENLLHYLPSTLKVAVEVRHPAFFQKGDAEKAFNQLLMATGANRMIMDTRALFKGPSTGALMDEVRTKKPHVPVNVLATSEHPVLRFVGHDDNLINDACLQPWVKKCHEWRLNRKHPYFFFHCPDNKDAPFLAQRFIDMYNQQYTQTPLRNIVDKVQPSLF